MEGRTDDVGRPKQTAQKPPGSPGTRREDPLILDPWTLGDPVESRIWDLASLEENRKFPRRVNSCNLKESGIKCNIELI